MALGEDHLVLSLRESALPLFYLCLTDQLLPEYSSIASVPLTSFPVEVNISLAQTLPTYTRAAPLYYLKAEKYGHDIARVTSIPSSPGSTDEL